MNALLLRWFDIIDETAFLSKGMEKFTPQSQQVIYSLGILISLELLRLDQDFAMESMSQYSYLQKPDVLVKLNSILGVKIVDYGAASPLLLAWSFVLHAFSLALMGQDNDGDADSKTGLAYNDPKYDDFLCQVLPKYKNIDDSNRLDVVEDLGMYSGGLASQAMKLGAFTKLAELFETLPQKLEYASTGANLLLTSLPYVNMTESIARVIHKIISPFKEVSEMFFLDVFADRALTLSKAKVPIAISPFLILGQCFGADLFDLISQMNSYMQELPKGFRDYDFVTREKTSQIELTSDLLLFEHRQEDGQGGFVLPAGTRGELISTAASSGATIVMWNCDYNGWTFLGRILEQSDLDGTWGQLELDILSVINNTLETLLERNRLDDAGELLNFLSAGLGQADIVALITRKLEDAFYNRDIKLCTAGVKFLTLLIAVDPRRVWPYLGRTKLLERNGRGGYLGIILGAVEIVNNDFEFTIAVIELVTALVRDSLASSLDTTISSKVRSEVLSKFTRHLIDVFESFSYWRYSKPEQRISIAISTLNLFSLIVHSTYRSDGATPLEEKVVATLSRASQLITNEFLSTAESAARTLSTILGAIESAAKSNDVLTGGTNLLDDHELIFVNIALQFSSLLVRVRSVLQLPCSYLERKLYEQSPDLVLIFLRYFALHSAVVDVLQSIIGGYWPDEQPSLLAHLGTQYSQMLIGCLGGALTTSLELDSTIAYICDYFSTIIESKQEGLSILLLSGKDTRNTTEKVETVVSLLTVLEERITRTAGESSQTKLPSMLADKMLNSISLAHSTWTLNAAEDKTELCKVLISYIKESLDVDEAVSSNFLLTDTSYKISIAARAIRIMSIQLYKSPKGPGAKAFLDFLSTDNNLIKYTKSFLVVNGFRPSLHGNLKRNFDHKWPKAPLSRYAATALLCNRPYGVEYLHDLGLLDIVLQNHVVWVDGYRGEVIEANVNLSYVDSQMCRVKSWCGFLTSLVLTASSLGDKNMLEKLNSVAAIAIETNLDDNLSLPFFRGIIKLRLDLAFFVSYNLSKTKMHTPTEQQLTTTFQLLADPSIEFLSAAGTSSLVLAGAEPGPEPGDSPVFYKQLLKILNLQLENISVDTGGFRLIQTIHGILDVVAIRGMKSVTNSIQENPTTSGVEDVVQITMILRKCLGFHGVSSLYSNLSQLMTDTGCDQAVMSLFAYSLDLCIVEDDPVFGELALIYLLEWLSIDIMADSLVLGGLLNVLTESPLARAIQHGVIRSTTHPRLFGIWTKGMLTIVLELLKQLGSRIVAEVIVFLNFYSAQIESALRYWLDPQVVISLSNIEETYQLYLLLDVVKKLADPDQTRVIPPFTDKVSVIDSLDYFLSHQRYLSSRLVVTTAEEQKLLLERPSNEDSTSVLAGKVVDQLADLREFLADSNN
ncbi:Nup188p [Sugiyamaella lignohabitans]|uniref:Nucleoporin NUP188 n=1 Tax=Sugiyamaella lignohabitans TaxID=796027 RepID=A0A167ELR4_9ASCO|nr:Nup188p [Sugiyamaella lignohabitans]ANB14226.1 Nup188p [Sugiyamaella lignohabitans]